MEIKEFIRHLIIEKKVSESTADAYERDVKYFEKFLKIRGVGRLEDAAGADVAAFVLALREHGRSDATINRRISSVRAFYKFLVSKGEISVNPAADIKTPRVKRNEIEFLTVDEVEKLLEQPDETVKGIRDRALLEIMYATGIKVSEVIELKLSDVNLKMGFVTLNGDHGRARIVPIGRPARAALSSYISTARKAFMKERNSEDPDGTLFVNYMGGPLTRQGCWKILSQCGKAAGIEGKITPHILRTSFAVHMVQNGADLKTLQELMGHEDVTAMKVYFSMTKNRIKDVYDRTHPRA